MRISDWSSDVCSSDLPYVVDVGKFIRRGNAGADRIAAVEILALGRAHHAGHLRHLRIARGKVVEDGVAEDMGCRPFRLDVGPRPADYDRQFQFEVHELAVQGPEDFRIRTDDRQGVAFMVEDRKSVVWGRGGSVSVDFG